MYRNLFFVIVSLIILTACEEVIQVDLNSAEPGFVVEAKIYTDSVCQVHLTRTNDYFSQEEPDFIENARVFISDQTSTEELSYIADGNYKGETIIGTENTSYKIEILYDGKTYMAESVMPERTEIKSVMFFKYNSQSIFNPKGEIVFTISVEFVDNPDTDNYYMIRFISDDKLLEKRYFLITEKDANGGSLSNLTNNTYLFSESIFTTGGEVDVQLFSIDEFTYTYFFSLDDILFWKRRLMPPTPYNPQSNINDAMGYFAALGYASEKIVLE